MSKSVIIKLGHTDCQHFACVKRMQTSMKAFITGTACTHWFQILEFLFSITETAAIRLWIFVIFLYKQFLVIYRGYSNFLLNMDFISSSEVENIYIS